MRFKTCIAALIQANQQVNLTRITNPDDFWEKHLWDSLQGIAPPWLVEEEGGASLAAAVPGADALNSRGYWHWGRIPRPAGGAGVSPMAGEPAGLDPQKKLPPLSRWSKLWA